MSEWEAEAHDRRVTELIEANNREAERLDREEAAFYAAQENR